MTSATLHALFAPRIHRTTVAIAIGAALVAVAVVVFAIGHWNSIYDDAFIYLRYVRNLKSGCGLRFNCHGVAVEGFTGPLYLAALWAGSLVTTQLIDLCQVVGVISLCVAGVLAIVAASRMTDQRDSYLPGALALATALAIALDPFALLNANIGMETATAAAVFTLVVFAAMTDRPKLLVAAVIAGVLVRPEGVLFVLALPLLPSMRRPRWLAVAAGALVLITALRYVLFGELAPNTFYAKSGGSWRHAELGLAYIATAILDFPLAALAPLALLGARRRACAYVLVASAAWLAFFLRTGGDTFEYSRLWFPLVPALTALGLAGVADIALRRDRPRLAMILPICVAVLAGGRARIAHDIPDQHWSPRIVEWIATGNYLRANYPRGTLIATVPIGAIGYFSSLPILDLVGLTEPDIAGAGRSVPPELLTKAWIGHERHFTEYVLARAPAMIVTTVHRAAPWTTLDEARAGFWADWLLLQEIKAGRAPYRVRDAEVAPGDHVLMFERE